LAADTAPQETGVQKPQVFEELMMFIMFFSYSCSYLSTTANQAHKNSG